MVSEVTKVSEDLITLVLVRLHVKSLLRLRCVCKVWYNLIKSSDFIAMHSNHLISETNHRVLIKRCLHDKVTNLLSVHSNVESLNTISADIKIPHLDHHYVELLGPCNGLVCITDYNSIVVCNPATREFTLLPDRPFAAPQDMYVHGDGVGFGYDANTDDYKFIRIFNLVDEDEFTCHTHKAELYRCSTNSWSEIDYDLPPTILYEPCFEIFFHGASHWYARREDGEKVLSYNIAIEVFQEFDFPDGCPLGDEKRKSLTIINGSLAMLSYTDPWGRHKDKQFIEVWLMSEYGIPNSWAKHFTVGPLLTLQHPITYWKNSALLAEKKNGQLMSCILDMQEENGFDVFACPTTLRALVYKESLVSMRK